VGFYREFTLPLVNYFASHVTCLIVFKLEMFMTQDRSLDCEETFRFLDRRLQEVGTVGRATSQVSDIKKLKKGVLKPIRHFSSLSLQPKMPSV
jgi:ubiquinone biosynthesis protein COQ9